MKWPFDSSPVPYILFWAVLNGVQATFTELFHDEALYWVCSQNLDWGLWDHPPFLPFLISLGYALIPNELGVRLFVILAGSLTILGIWRLTRPLDNRLFFALVFSVFLVHIGGFMAAPDIPLLTFSVWFLVLLRQYCNRDSWLAAIGLGFLVAGMAYSKYHGAVFLFFLLLPNLKLMMRHSFWAIPFLALGLFSPHLYWQWSHDFPTFRYHLIDRAGDAYQWAFITDYIGGQLLVMGPFTSILLFLAAIRYRAKEPFERTLKWGLWGVLGFFLFQSFSQRTEANWTATAFIPMIYLAYRYIENKPVWRKWSFRLFIPSILLLLLFRLYLMVDFLPSGANPRNEFHGWDRWAWDISEIADGRPVVFHNTYRGPSKYAFYSKQTGHSVNGDSHSGNQYDLLTDQEAEIQGKEVMIVNQFLEQGIPFTPGGKKEQRYSFFKDFRSYNRIGIRIPNAPQQLPADTLIQLEIRVKNRTDEDILFAESSRKVSIHYQFYLGDEVVLDGQAAEAIPVEGIPAKEEQVWKVSLQTPAGPGLYRYRYAFAVEGLLQGRNGNFNNLEVRGN